MKASAQKKGRKKDKNGANFKRTIVKYFPNFIENINAYIQGVQHIPCGISAGIHSRR